MSLIKTSKVGMESYQGAVHGRKGTFLPSCKLGLCSTITHEVQKKFITEMFPLNACKQGDNEKHEKFLK